jgi:hypothetical protein
MLRKSQLGWALVAAGMGLGEISAQGQLFIEDHETFAIGTLDGQGGWTANSLFKVFDLGGFIAAFGARSVGLDTTSTAGVTIEARLDLDPVASFGRIGFDLIMLHDTTLMLPSIFDFTILGTDGVTEFTHAKIRIDSNGAISVMQSNFVDSALTQPLIVPTSAKVPSLFNYRIEFEIPGDGSLRIFVNGTLRYANTSINFMESGGQCGQGPISALIMQVKTFTATESIIIDNIQLDAMTQSFFNCPPSCPADLNSDGAVDGADLGLLLGGWGVCPP